jgi:hypothetical protein
VVLALSAASSADAVATRSFSTSASARASLYASESHSVVAAVAAVWEEMTRPSADCRAVSRDVRTDALLATAAASATRATTRCISN